jgi:bisphosphoglycerate-dependent phosphoglycerate mutase
MGVAGGEMAEKQLDILITRRHDRRVADEGERQALEMWQESERKYAERRGEENRQAWASFHEEQAERHRRTLAGLVAGHEAAAVQLREVGASSGCQ